MGAGFFRREIGHCRDLGQAVQRLFQARGALLMPGICNSVEHDDCGSAAVPTGAPGGS